MLKTLRIDAIRIDGGTQVREQDHPEYAQALADDLANGDLMPPPLVFDDGDNLWMCQGFYRLRAAKACGKDEIECEVREGTLQDAIWAAIPSNREHGLRRSHADIIKVIKMAVQHPNALETTQADLARYLGVARQTVAKYASQARPPVDAATDPAEPPDDAVAPTLPPSRELWEKSGVKNRPRQKRDDVNFNIPPETVDVRPARADADLPPSQSDDSGMDVPEPIIPIFEARATFGSIVRRLREIKGEVKALAKRPEGQFLAESEEVIQYGLDEAIAAIEGAAPSLVDGNGGWQPRMATEG